MTLTASRISLARACPVAFALPQTHEQHAGQAEGDERHAELEADVNRGDVPDVLAQRWPGYTWRSEVAYAVNVATGEGRELGVGIGRAYGDLRPYEIAGTADLVGLGPQGQLVVCDRKSHDPHVPRAAHNWQLRTLALAATGTLGLDECEVAIWHELRPLDVHMLDAIDLVDAMGQLRALVVAVSTARQRYEDGAIAPTPGPHCRYCSAFHACPKQRELAELVRGPAIEQRIEATIPFADDESAADAYELSQRIRMLLRRIDTALYARAASRPIPLRNGKLFGPRTRPGNEVLSGDVVHAVLAERYGRDIADAAVERKATKTKLRDALGFAVGKGEVASAERAVLDDVRKRGGSERRATTRTEEYEPRPMLVADEEGAA